MTIERVIPPRKQPLSVDRIRIHFDGVVFQEKPHPAAWSFIAYLNDEKIFHTAAIIEREVNDVEARMIGMSAALEWLNFQDRYQDHITLLNDNHFVIQSMGVGRPPPDKKEYRPLWFQCRKLAAPFYDIQFVWITKLANRDCRLLSLVELQQFQNTKQAVV